jgi:hypothetical protein
LQLHLRNQRVSQRWHFQPEHIKVDDGDLAAADYETKYKNLSDIKDGKCSVCKNCTNLKTNLKKDGECINYINPDTKLNYPNK